MARALSSAELRDMGERLIRIADHRDGARRALHDELDGFPSKSNRGTQVDLSGRKHPRAPLITTDSTDGVAVLGELVADPPERVKESTGIGGSITERLAGHDDIARKALERIDSLSGALLHTGVQRGVDELLGLVVRHNIKAAVPKRDPADDDKYCNSCLRIGVSTDRKQRRQFCTWCADFVDEQGQEPSRALLRIHHAEPHTRINRAMRDRDAREQKQAASKAKNKAGRPPRQKAATP